MKTISKLKQAAIDAYLAEPIKVNDVVEVIGLGRQDKASWGNSTQVKGVIENGDILIEEYGSTKKINKGDYRKTTYHIGKNPFTTLKDRVENISFTLESILFKLGLTKEKDERHAVDGVTIKNVEFNPFVYDNEGKKVYYQRPLVWTLEDKQLLLDSIYNNIDCGKILIRRRGWDEVRKLIADGEKQIAWSDVVDGKQRLHTMAEFINDEFPDAEGNYFGDLTHNAQYSVLNHQLMSYSELPENTADKDVITQFLKLNFAGVPQSKEHIEFVKNIHLNR